MTDNRHGTGMPWGAGASLWNPNTRPSLVERRSRGRAPPGWLPQDLGHCALPFASVCSHGIFKCMSTSGSISVLAPFPISTSATLESPELHRGQSEVQHTVREALAIPRPLPHASLQRATGTRSGSANLLSHAELSILSQGPCLIVSGWTLAGEETPTAALGPLAGPLPPSTGVLCPSVQLPGEWGTWCGPRLCPLGTPLCPLQHTGRCGRVGSALLAGQLLWTVCPFDGWACHPPEVRTHLS